MLKQQSSAKANDGRLLNPAEILASDATGLGPNNVCLVDMGAPPQETPAGCAVFMILDLGAKTLHLLVLCLYGCFHPICGNRSSRVATPNCLTSRLPSIRH